MSLSPRPEMVTTTFSSLRNFSLGSAAKACELSSAGMMPSSLVSCSAACNASSSVAESTVSLPTSAK